jgi:cytochrome c peroxidase
MKKSIFFAVLMIAALFVVNSAGASAQEKLLGSFLYFDTNLSKPAGQSCASCHHPKAAFADPDSELPVSEGVISGRFGGRNTPTSAYADFSPAFYFDGELWIGGQFWDGRAATLEEQAKGPFLNPVEMNNTKEGVVSAVRKSSYAWLFKQVYGANSLKDTETAYNLVAKAIAAFEGTKALNRFTSKYDLYLKTGRGLSPKELRGLALFKGPAKGNCAACHPSTSADGGVTPPLFTDFSYDNLGIPKNSEIDELKGPQPIDLGLGVTVKDEAENGKFKVPTLRNVGKTGPYGHNGYFKTLQDIVHFYNTRDVKGADWEPAEYINTVNHIELGNLGLTSAEEGDIVAFLMTLTDGYLFKSLF